MSLFGFSTEPSAGGDFTPIVKYDSRSGRVSRVDRIDVGGGNFESHPADITNTPFTAIMDLDNLEVGYIDFASGGAPSFVMTPMQDNVRLPQNPGGKHKPGIRLLIKLNKACAGETPMVREIAGTAKTMVGGFEALYQQYRSQRGQHTGQLPVVTLTGSMPVKTGSGAKSSTNYRPIFEIKGWVARPSDLVHKPRGSTTSASGSGQPQQQQGAPATGAAYAPPPQKQPAADDFG